MPRRTTCGAADRVDERAVVERPHQSDLLLAEEVEAIRPVAREASQPDSRARVERIVQGREEGARRERDPVRPR